MKKEQSFGASEKGVIAWFARNPVAANLLMASILILGVFSAAALRIEGFPAMDPTNIDIDVTYLSGSARQAEEGIAIKIEEALQGVEGIKEIRSTSTASGATVTVERNSSYDLEQLNDEVKNKVDGIFGFPGDAEKPVISKQLWEENALWINLYGDTDQQTLQKLARQFEQALLRLPAINKVVKTGWKTPEIAIEVDELTLQEHNLTLNDLAQRIGNESLSETSGELRSRNGLILLKADKQRYYQRDFADILISVNADGSETRLSDIATIRDAFEETPNVLSRFQGKPSINLQILVSKNADIIGVAREAKSLVAEWQQSHRLPENVAIAAWWDQSNFMLERMQLLLKNGAIGISLVMLVLAIFLNLRVAFWVGMGVPICFAGALLMMGENLFDLTLNELTTFGFIIVLGILVDDAVVVGESIYATRTQEGDSLGSTIKGVKRIAVPTLFGVLTTLAAFYPLSFIGGILGEIFSQFALIAVACLMFSMIESKLILPAHLAHIDTGSKPARNPFSRAMNLIQKRANDLLLFLDQKIYQPAIQWASSHRYSVLGLFLALFVLVIGLVPSGKVGFVFFPKIPRDIIEIYYTAEEGSGYGISHQQADEIESIVAELNHQWQQMYPGKGPVIVQLQSQVSDDKNGHIVMELSPQKNRSVVTDEVVEQLREAIGKPEGLRQLKVLNSWIGLDNFALKLLTDDRQQLEIATSKVVEALTALPGITDIQNNLLTGQPQLTFELTSEGRARGMDTASLAQQIQQAFYGAEVQRVQRGKDEVKIRVRYPAEQRRDITRLQDARIRTPNGDIVPLSSIAEIKSGFTETEIHRVNGRLAATLSANINKAVTSPAEIMAALQQSVFAELRINNPGLEIIQAGEVSEQQETSKSMMMMFGLALMLIYILVAIPLKSYWQPLIIMSAIPFGIVGAILGHWFNDLSISILSLNGILALSGVVVNNSLLLVNRFNELRRTGSTTLQAIARAGSQRLRAILLTSLTTYAGLASLLQETSESAQYLIPAAASLAYGILFATVITLVLVPVLLLIADDLRSWFNPGKQQPAEQPLHLQKAS